jgi:hypothetical protein
LESRIGPVHETVIVLDTRVAELNEAGAKSFIASWKELVGVIACKCAALRKTS